MNTIHVCTFFGPPGIGQNKLCKISTRTSKSGLRQGEKNEDKSGRYGISHERDQT